MESLSNYGFKDTFQYNLIYVMRINDERHKGLLKVGKASTSLYNDEDFLPNSNVMNDAANKRIKEYTKTAGIIYELLWTEVAITKTNESFGDYDIHRVLMNSGFKKVNLETGADEWFRIDLETVKNAIKAYKNGYMSLTRDKISQDRSPIIFRPEQKEAIEKTLKQFKTGTKMLWNAKMRFGKTLCALEVVKRKNFAKTIIITHRPVVKDGWFEDFDKIFYDRDDYLVGSKDKDNINSLEKSGKSYVYFASLQDLRGSERVGGKFDKNHEVFNIEWDFIVIDEAHEGTQTELGKSVIQELLKGEKDPYVLELSGTPFNLLTMYEEPEIYTWDYVMEQQAKADWTRNNYLDSNPYEDLPRLNIYTYNLDKSIPNYQDLEDKAFNFREFFRTWTGNLEFDGKYIPEYSSKGSFVHEKDVEYFLNLLVKKDKNDNYPFSTEEYRDFFRHTFWVLPGVREAKALEKLMKKHPVFGSGDFNIINVAGDGINEQEEDNALDAVRNAIGKEPEKTRTITLSCGRLTTGVTIPAWTAVFMLSGSYSTSASSYLQTIFRVQTPAKIGGRVKSECYVFDFAPDRTLKMVAEAAKLNVNTGNETEKVRMGNFLNFCPVIAVEGSDMQPYNVDAMLIQLKKAYISRVIKNGFDDPKMYNDNLLKLDELEIKMFNDMRKIVGKSNQTKRMEELDVNTQGFSEEEYEELEKIKKKKRRELTEEEQEKLEEFNRRKRERSKAISVLRAISIRIPLLIYGANISIDKDITIDNLTEIVDDVSWLEFMPDRVTKEKFKNFSKYYDKEVFLEAARRIRKRTLDADNLPIIERIEKITQLFSTFKNPDKETVLTPWRVVNMHLGDTIGGYNFYDNNYQQTLLEPRLITYPYITNDVFKPDSKILEINSKTGLYPLYVAYSIFRYKLLNYNKMIKDLEDKENVTESLWKDTLRENVYVLCKSPMAVSITKRTLAGYNDYNINVEYYKNLVDDMKNEKDKVVNKLKNPKFWSKEKEGKIMFDAVVGNPPYQESDNGERDDDAPRNASSSPLYDEFTLVSQKVTNQYLSLIMPSRWMVGGKGLDSFRKKMLNDSRFKKLYDYPNENEIFDNVSIKGGVCYFLWDKNYDGDCDIYIKDADKILEQTRKLNAGNTGVFIRFEELIFIKEKVWDKYNKKQKSISNIISVRKPYDLRTDVLMKPKKYGISKIYNSKEEMLKVGIKENNILEVFGLVKLKRVKKYIKRDEIIKGMDTIDMYKVFVPYAYGCGAIGEQIPSPIQVCTETFLRYGSFNTKQEAENALKYLKTKFFRALAGILKITQHSTNKTYEYVPIQDFTDNSDIDWSKDIVDIDKQLYLKYNLNEKEIEFIETRIAVMK